MQIGHLKKGLNPVSVGELAFGSPHMSLALKTGIVVGIIGLAVSKQIYIYIYIIP